MDFAYTAYPWICYGHCACELHICLLQSPNRAYNVKPPSEMRIVQLRKSRLFKIVIAALFIIPLIYILFLQSRHEDIKFSAFGSKKVKTVSLFGLIQSSSAPKVVWFLTF
jgi:hypothetical protein